MDKLIDKLILFAIGLVLYIPTSDHVYMVIPILVVVILSALLSYFEENGIVLCITFAYIIACFYDPSFLYFLPLICYDIFFIRVKWLWILLLLPFVIDLANSLTLSKLSIAAIIVVAYTLKFRTLSLQNMKREYYNLQYNSKEMSLELEKKNKSLMEKQNYEINLATLNERNRIARDIHDNVGHILSRSILQVAALLTVNKDENIEQSLSSVKDTLVEAMDNIRKSVHNLHEESIDLQTEIQKLIDSIEFFSITFDYDVKTNPHRELKYCFISVVKEALANIIKHSNATKVSITIREHPGLYQLIVQDNGTPKDLQTQNRYIIDTNYEIKKGIGLNNIEDRVAALKGNVNISFGKGFRIFISIPKK